MNKQTEALKLALGALEKLLNEYYADTTCRSDLEKAEDAITAIREALAEQPYPDNFIDALMYDVAKRDSDAQQAYEDAFVNGTGVMLGDKRIDPASVYKEPEQEPWPEEPEGHVAGLPQPSRQKEPWAERWYGSGPERGWWIVCGRDHIAHLGPSEFAQEAASKIVAAHNTSLQPAQQQEPFGWVVENKHGGKCFSQTMAGVYTDTAVKVTTVYTSPPAQRKPLTDEEIVKITADPCLYIRGGDYRIDIARAIEAAHGIKE